jgi:hypothetical protein
MKWRYSIIRNNFRWRRGKRLVKEIKKYQDQLLFSITWPLFIELSLHMSMGIIATLILISYSDNAVAGVGVANQIINIFILVFNVTAIGATILIGQNLGANQLDRAHNLANPLLHAYTTKIKQRTFPSKITQRTRSLPPIHLTPYFSSIKSFITSWAALSPDATAPFK